MDNAERIIKYIDKELSETEEAAFEKDLINSPELMKEYMLHVEVDEFLEKKFADETSNSKIETEPQDEDIAKEVLAIEEDAFKNNVFNETLKHVKEWEEEKESLELDEIKSFVSQGIDSAQQKENSNKSIQLETKNIAAVSKNKWIYWAAPIAAILVIGFFLFKLNDVDKTSQQISAAYNEPFKFIDRDNRGENIKIKSVEIKAESLYNKQQFDKAILAAKDVLDIDKDNTTAHFIIGLSLMGKDDFKNASEEFLIVIAANNKYHFESKWYLGLCYLYLNKKNEAIEVFKKLEVSTKKYEDLSEKILNELQE